MAEADKSAFMDAQSEAKVEPVAVIEMLVSSGLLKQNLTNRRLQFTYDPVAEYLAAWRLKNSNVETAVEMRKRIASNPESAIGRALNEMVAGASGEDRSISGIPDTAPAT